MELDATIERAAMRTQSPNYHQIGLLMHDIRKRTPLPNGDEPDPPTLEMIKRVIKRLELSKTRKPVVHNERRHEVTKTTF